MVFGGLITISNYAGAAIQPPPSGNFMITEIGDLLMTDESGNLMITE